MEKGPFIYFIRNILGNGHFSKCFYSIDPISGKEVAIKFALNEKKMINYKKEGIILSKLADENFYPKLFNFNSELDMKYLGMTLMGPNLLNIVNFFDKKYFGINIIKNIWLCLIDALEYLHSHKIIHRDIKPEYIVWGIYENNNLYNNDCLYLIDYGESDYLGSNYLGIKQDIQPKRGTKHFMSKNNHRRGTPCSSDDIESLIYCLLFMSIIGLPWDKIKDLPSCYENTLLKYKQDFDYWCGKDFEFLADILEYLKIIHEEKKEMNYHVLKKLMGKQEIEENKNPNRR